MAEQLSFSRMKTSGVLFLAVFLSLLLPRIFELDRFATIDEPEWIFQSANFYYALGQRDFAQTYRREHPGVTALWAGAASYLINFPEYRGFGQGYIETAKMERYLRSLDQQPIQLLQTARVVLVVAASALLTLSFYYAARLFGLWPAFWGLLLVAFDPFHIALSRVLHHDAMLGSFMFLSLLAFLAYLFRGRRRVDLVVSASAAGWALLTKVPGVFIFLYLGFLSALLFFFQRRESASIGSHAPLTRSRLASFARPYLAWLLLAALAFIIFWPVMWVQPLQALEKSFGHALRYSGGGDWVFFDGRFFTGGIGLDYAYFYPLTYLWRATPVVLVGLLLFFLVLAFRWMGNQPRGTLLALACLGLFAVLFGIFMTIGTKKFDRYLLPAYLPLDLMAGLGWVWAAGEFSRRTSGAFSRYASALVPGFAILAQAFFSLSHYPYYFTYFNPLMGGVRKAPEVMSVGWGEGLNLAADYFRAYHENPEDLQVISGMGPGGLTFFFEGAFVRPFPLGPELTSAGVETLLETDYYIQYGMDIQYLALHPEDFFNRYQPEHVIWINGIEYARIYNLHELPVYELLPPAYANPDSNPPN
jgi:4-amino-4-deoxy-L-arabinose transferase-like glycosyltransferase